MYPYINIPQAEPEDAIEPPDITMTTSCTFSPQTHQDAAAQAPSLHYPVSTVAVSYANAGAQQATIPKEPNPSSRICTGVALQSAQVEPRHQEHDHGRPIFHPCLRYHPEMHGQSQLQMSLPSYPNSHTLPIQLPIPIPAQHLHLHTNDISTAQWNPISAPVSAPILPSPSSQSGSRQQYVPFEQPIQSARQMMPVSASPHVSQMEHLSADGLQNPQKVNPNRAVTCQRQCDVPDIPQRSPRKRQKRSFVWNYFDESDTDPNIAICRMCRQSIPRGRNLARNTTNLKKHLEHRHPSIFDNAEFRASYQPNRGNVKSTHRSSSPPETFKQTLSTGCPINFPLDRQALDSQGSRIDQSQSYPSNLRASSFQCQQAQPNVLHTKETQRSYNRTRKDIKTSTSSVEEYAVATKTKDSGKLTVIPPFCQPVQEELTYGIQPSDNCSPLELRESKIKENDSGATAGPCARVRVLPINTDVEIVPASRTLESSLPTDAQEVGSGLIDFLAIMNFPLTASKSRGFACLFDDAKVKVLFPNISRLRDSIIPEKLELMNIRIKDCLLAVGKIVLVVESTGTTNVVLCQYYNHECKHRIMCLGAFSDTRELQLYSNTSASDLETVAVKENPLMQQSEHVLKGVLWQVNRIADKWDIHDKVLAVVVPCGTRAQWTEPKHSQPENNFCGSAGATSDLMPTRVHQPYDSKAFGTTETGIVNIKGLQCREELPIARCLITTFESIYSRTVCTNPNVRRQLIDPMSRGIFEAWTDETFSLSEKQSARSPLLKLPLKNLSIEGMMAAVRYFTENYESIQNLMLGCSQKGGNEVLRMSVNQLKNFADLLRAFVESLRIIRDFNDEHCIFRCENMSIGLPIVGQFFRKVESIQSTGGMLSYVAADILQLARDELLRMESHSLYACATLLDPRFKDQFFTTIEVTDRVKSMVVQQCEKENKKQKESKKAYDGQGPRMHSSNIPQSIDRINPVFSVKSTALESLAKYLSEPAIELRDDINEYWKAHQEQWPALTKIAFDYALIPSTCEINRTTSVLGDYRNIRGLDSRETSRDDHTALTYLKNNLLLADDYLKLSSSR